MSDIVELSIPDPCLVVLVGAAGAGKSTFAARHFNPDEVLSSDAFRERVAGDAADQQATGPAFAALHRSLRHRLALRQLTVVDATSVVRRSRRSLARAAEAAGLPCVAVVLDLPAEVVLARNAGRRDRRVPEQAVRRQLRWLAISLRPPGLASEGFGRVHTLRDPGEIERTVVRREPAGGTGPIP